MASKAEQAAARNATKKALRKGVIVARTSCEWCGGTERIHCHHNDYSDPLNVSWLCAGCHRAAHGVLSRAQVVWVRETVSGAQTPPHVAAKLLNVQVPVVHGVLKGATYRKFAHPSIIEQRDQLLAFVRAVADGGPVRRAAARALVAKYAPPYMIDPATQKPMPVPEPRKPGRPRKGK